MVGATVERQHWMAEAGAMVRQQNYKEAERIYRMLVEHDPPNPQAWVNLGVICGLQENPGERLRCFAEAIRLDPTHLPAWLNRGIALSKESHFAEARDCFSRAVSLDGTNQLAHAGLGLCLGMTGELEAALAAYQQAVEHGLSDHKQGHFQLGKELFLAEDFQSAIAVFRAGLHSLGDHIDSLLVLGMALHRAGELEQAAEVFLYLLSIEPEHDEALTLYGHLLTELNQHDQAIDLYQRALQANPQSALAANLLGQLHADFGETHKAIPLFKQALDADPQCIGILVNLASAYRAQGQLEQSIATFQQLLNEDPDNIPGMQGLMFTYSIAGPRYSQATAELGRSWRARARQGLQARSGSGRGPVQAPLAIVPGRKLRIGVLSAEFKGHCVTTFLNSYLHHYNRDRFEVEGITTVYLPRETEQEVRRHVADLLKVYDVSQEKARNLLRSRNYDLIVDTSGFTRNSGIELLGERCAPVQYHYIGYHASLGMDTIDYFIGDGDTAAPELQGQYGETLWRLPRAWLACTPGTPFPRATSTATTEQVVLGSFNQLAKVGEQTLTCWAAALHAVPGSILVIKDRLIADPTITQRILDFMAQQQIQAERIRFLGRNISWSDHLLTYNQIDIALDTTPWSSATTGFDALGMGVPLVAIRGDATISRMSSSLVRALDRPEWEAHDGESFAATVATLASSHRTLRAAKASLQQEVLASPLYNGQDLAQHLDRAFAAMIQQKSPQAVA